MYSLYSDCFVGFFTLSLFSDFDFIRLFFSGYYLVLNVKLLLLMVYKLFKEFFLKKKVFFTRVHVNFSVFKKCIFTSYRFDDCNFAAIYLLLVSFSYYLFFKT